MLFTFGIAGNAFALKDMATEQIYDPKDLGGGSYLFGETKMPNLMYMPYFGIGDSAFFNGDMTIEIASPFCVAYAAAFLVAMNVGNLEVKFAAVLTLVALVSIIYGIAFSKLKDLELCGADWLVWGYETNESIAISNINKYYPTFGAHRGSWAWISEKCVKNLDDCIAWCNKRGIKLGGAMNSGKVIHMNCEVDGTCLTEGGGSLAPCYLYTEFLNENGTMRDYLDMRDKLYRQYYYGGVEIRSDVCVDPRIEAKTYDVNNGYGKDNYKENGFPKQLYYFRGTETPNYACDRFLVDKLDPKYDNMSVDSPSHPYQCCVNESRRKVCVYDHRNTPVAGSAGSDTPAKFCDIGNTLCSINGIILQLTPGTGVDKYCVSTWSLCPYNFNLQKGSEKRLEFEFEVSTSNNTLTVNDPCQSKIKVGDEEQVETLSCKGQPKNFYQLDRHCVYLSPADTNLDEAETYSPYFDKACINMVGSSHNTVSYSTYSGYRRASGRYSSSFSAPLVECFTETFKNALNNVAGHTRCNDPNEIPGDDESCVSGAVFIKGERFDETGTYTSPIAKLLKLLRTLILDAMVIMLMLYGLKVLMDMGKFEMRDLYIMMIKITIVLGFSYDIFWSRQLSQMVYTFSDWITSNVTKVTIDTDTDLRGNLIRSDGCYFGNVADLIGSLDEWKLQEIPNNNYASYPSGRKYVMFFDTLDCKVSKWLGMSMLGNTSKIIKMVAMTFIFPFNLGLFMLVGSLVFVFFVVNFIIKAVYSFVGASMSLFMYMYLSPLMIPCILFKKTKPFFDAWVKSIVSNIITPIVLFIFLSMSLAIIDQYLLGEAVYVGSGRDKQLMCGYACFQKRVSGYDGGTGYLETRRMLIDHVDSRDINSDSFKEKQNACYNVADGGTEWVDLKENSFMCFMNELNAHPFSPLQALGVFITQLGDVKSSDLAMIVRCAFLLLILNAVLTSLPSVSRALVDSNDMATSTIRSDPFDLALKAYKMANTAKRISKQTADGLRNKLIARPAGKVRDAFRNHSVDEALQHGEDGKAPKKDESGGGEAPGGSDNDGGGGSSSEGGGNAASSNGGSDSSNGGGGGDAPSPQPAPTPAPTPENGG
ncbi:MAG: type IV secretion system protein [Rickettsiales bacterium]|nr:type IV secretion system protein [Rickettsiales bacterium]